MSNRIYLTCNDSGTGDTLYGYDPWCDVYLCALLDANMCAYVMYPYTVSGCTATSTKYFVRHTDSLYYVDVPDCCGSCKTCCEGDDYKLQWKGHLRIWYEGALVCECEETDWTDMVRNSSGSCSWYINCVCWESYTHANPLVELCHDNDSIELTVGMDNIGFVSQVTEPGGVCFPNPNPTTAFTHTEGSDGSLSYRVSVSISIRVLGVEP